MAELSDVKIAVHVAPIWRKPRRIKSFKQAAVIVLKLIRLGVCKKSSNLTVDVMSAKLKELANEGELKEQRLNKVKCLASRKNQHQMPHETKEWRQHFFKVYREKFRQLKMMEQMGRYSNYCVDKSTNNAACFGKLRNCDMEGRKLGSPPCMRSKLMYYTEDRKVKTPTPKSKLSHKREIKPSTKATNIVGNRTVQHSFARGGAKKDLASSNASPKDNEKKNQLSSTDGMCDPRFQNLMRSLTPVDC